MLTIKHSVGQKVGQLQGRNPRAALGLAGVPRALPVGCCALSFHQISLFWGQNVCHKGHTRTYLPSALAGPKASLEQFPNELSKPLKHRGRVGSARGVAGATPQVPVNPPQTPPGGGQGRFPGLSSLHSTSIPTLGLSQLCVTSQRGSTRAHVALGTRLGAVPALAALPAAQAALTLTCFGCRALMGSGAAKKSWWKHVGWLPWRGTGTAPPPLPCRDLLFLPFHRCGFSSGGSVEEVNGLSPFRP